MYESVTWTRVTPAPIPRFGNNGNQSEPWLTTVVTATTATVLTIRFSRVSCTCTKERIRTAECKEQNRNIVHSDTDLSSPVFLSLFPSYVCLRLSGCHFPCCTNHNFVLISVCVCPLHAICPTQSSLLYLISDY